MVKLEDKELSLINSFIEDVKNRYKVSGVYLFGSRVSGKSTGMSDIDVCVVLDESVDWGIKLDVFSIAQKKSPLIEAVTITQMDFRLNSSDIVCEIKEKGVKVA